MSVYSSIRYLANVLDLVRVEFYSLYASTRNVWLIGQYLSLFFLSVSNHVLILETRVINLADDWSEFYDWVSENLGSSNVPALLLQYADDLISFIREPFDWIADTIRDFFPELQQITRDPVSFVLEILYRYTGLDIDFVDNPRNVIRNIIHDTVGDLVDIARNPSAWIIGELNNIIPNFQKFIADTRGWVRDQIEDEFPNIVDFLRNPEQFIAERLIDFLDDLADKYRDKAVKVTEKILNAIF